MAQEEPKGRVILGTVGAFRVEKALINLVRAVHELTARGADVGALIVGDGSQRPQIEREIQRLGVDGRERLVGENQDVRPYLASMDIFVLTSVTGETFSNAVLEAMAMSLPVVVSRVGGMDEMLRFGGGMIYPPGDVKSLCDLLMPLVSSRAARTRLGRPGAPGGGEAFQLFPDVERLRRAGSRRAVARAANPPRLPART
jgi:glycosyltransferase involved in cell wall biosynthesis